MKSLTRSMMLVLAVMLWCHTPAHAVNYYTSLHGTDTGPTGNVSVMSFTSPTFFRVLIPPGATYMNLSMNCQNQAEVTTVARFGQAPSNYLPIPTSSSPSPKSFDNARTGNIFSGNGDGILNVTTRYFSPPLAESQAGWLYVDIVGGGVNHIDYDLTVNSAIYTEWYNRTKGNIDCSCTQTGTCAMCTSGGGTTYTTCSSAQYCPSQYRNPSNSNQCQLGQCLNYMTCSNNQTCPAIYQNPTNSNQCQIGQCLSNPYVSCLSGQYCPVLYRNPNNTSQCQNGQCLNYVTCPSGQYCPSQYQNPTNSSQCQIGQCVASVTWTSCASSQYCPSQYRNPNNSAQCQSGQCQSYIFCPNGQYCLSQYRNPNNTSPQMCQNSSLCQTYVVCPTGTACIAQYQNPNNSSQCETASSCQGQTDSLCNTSPWVCWNQGKVCSEGVCVDPTSPHQVWNPGTGNLLDVGATAGRLVSTYFSMANVATLIGGKDKNMVIQPRVRFTGVPAGNYEIFAMMSEEKGKTLYMATKDRLFGTVFVDYRGGDRIRNYDKRQLPAGEVILTFDAFGDLEALNLTPQGCVTYDYRFYVGFAPDGEVALKNFNNFRGVEIYLVSP